MILILSNDVDETTNLVLDWLHYYEAKFWRINGEDLTNLNLNIRLNAEQNYFYLRRKDSDKTIANDLFRVVWFRRWGHPLLHNKRFETESIEHQVLMYLRSEHSALTNILFTNLAHCEWINSLDDLRLNKIYVLGEAVKVGLDVPDTLICHTKKELQQFLVSHPKIISKSIGDTTFFSDQDKVFGNYTVSITEEDVENFQETFFPSLLQEQIAKKYEIRTFYLEGAFYSMAIFSQQDEQTTVDFRQYLLDKPNRNVPYKLPKSEEEKLQQLMTSINLKSGSIDMIKGIDGRYVFLEVNPLGQFSMVSYPCNYQLERKMAERLIQKNEAYGEQD